ncbi:MAG TPA: ABC transporter permease subunit [Candidatus Limnocylindrales bacterium]|nr:ABC transporter permease subunit [Candidatus Limnocylindrales bacterium]
MAWLSLSLIALIISLALVLLFGTHPRLWPRLRFAAILGFQVSGVLACTVILVTLAQLAIAPGQSAPPVNAASVIAIAFRNSLFLIVAASVWGTAAGFGAAFALIWFRRRVPALAIMAALLWVVPTFLLAIAVQEIQAQIYNATSLSTSGGYGRVTVGLVFWGAVVLGIRPAAYVFRRADPILQDATRQLFVRTASAKGLGWHEVASRHVLRPTLPVLISTWLISFRLMVGSLPLVEYFFGFPGLGRLFVLNIPVAGQPGNADLAIAAVAALAGLFLLLEAAAAIAQQSVDPRLRDVRAGEAAVA